MKILINCQRINNIINEVINYHNPYFEGNAVTAQATQWRRCSPLLMAGYRVIETGHYSHQQGQSKYPDIQLILLPLSTARAAVAPWSGAVTASTKVTYLPRNGIISPLP